MKTRTWLSLAATAVLAFALMMGGCAKKQTAAEPAPAPAPAPAAAPAPDNKDKELAAAKAAIAGEKVYFNFDKFDIQPEGRTALNKKAELLKKFPEIKVLVEGHCDARGTSEYNMALGQRRAKAAYDYLVIVGVKAGQLETVSFGKERPAEAGKTEAAYAKNRRDEFKVK